jgi:hypothetical protein
MRKLKKAILADADRAMKDLTKAAADVRKCETVQLGALALQRMRIAKNRYAEALEELGLLLQAEQMGKLESREETAK